MQDMDLRDLFILLDTFRLDPMNCEQHNLGNRVGSF
jgi:hypothetical protein